MSIHYELFIAQELEGARPSSKTRRELLKEAYGVDLKWGLWYDFTEERRHFEILKDSLAVLDLVKGDAVLLHNGESPVFARRGGELTLNSNAKSGWWPPEYVAMVRGPYKLADLPIL